MSEVGERRVRIYKYYLCTIIEMQEEVNNHTSMKLFFLDSGVIVSQFEWIPRTWFPHV